jgi:hypothetical protein
VEVTEGGLEKGWKNRANQRARRLVGPAIAFVGRMNSPGQSGSDGVAREQANDGTDAAERMRRAIGAVSKGTGSRDELKTAARELVEQLRSEHERPEQLLLHIKQLLAESGLRPSYGTPPHGSLLPSDDDSLYRDVIAWSIRQYYEPST